MTVRILLGDCLHRLRDLADCSVDSIVTDPPYGIRFMGKAWDGADIEKRYQEANTKSAARQRTGRAAAAAAGKYNRSLSASIAFQKFTEEWAREALRVIKPGGYLLCFASTRTYHRMTCGIEDAGFEVKEQIAWTFGSGFPKSHNGEWGGTALKPAWEPICMARKPLIGTVEMNWREHGTGALNIDGCRIPVDDDAYARNCSGDRGHAGTRTEDREGATDLHTGGGSASSIGRWPANLIHDGSDEVVAMFPREAGAQAQASGSARTGRSESMARNHMLGTETPAPFHADSGSAARFFYCAKASREDRNDGCSHMQKRPLNWSSGDANPGAFQAAGTDRSAQNDHPTVKPTDLMAYLVRLVTPRGGVVLDPFMGSGSTGRGAVIEGMHFIGIELDPRYVEIARCRIRAQAGMFYEEVA